MEIILYILFLLLFVYGAWLIISSTQKKKPRLLQLPAHQDIYPGQDVYQGQDIILQNHCHGQDESLQNYPGQNYPGENEILHQQQRSKFQAMTRANKERQRLEVEHKKILTEALKEILTSELTEFDIIYSVYIEKCTLQKSKPRGRDRVKAYLREMEQNGLVNRERQGRQILYSTG